jgi:hypothetical protein
LTDPKKIMTALTRASGLKPKEWAGKCYQLACCLVKHKIVAGTAVYGHWRGPIKKGSMFDRGVPFAQHGWVKRGNRYRGIIDPTRWVFEGNRPYIYIGPDDHYDEGGNRFREATHGEAPSYVPGTSSVRMEGISDGAWMYVQNLLLRSGASSTNPIPILSIAQLFWIGNQPPHLFEDYAVEIYQTYERIGRRAVIPIDNWRMVERGDSAGSAP